jgi:uncharacterized membrane protein
MININYKRELVLWPILITPIVYTVYEWGQLPARVAIHFDLNGTPNGWGSKASLFGPPAISIFTYLLLLYLPQIDPKRMSDEQSLRMFYKIRVVMVIFLSAISIFLTYNSVDGTKVTSLSHDVAPCVFLLLSVLGNFMINIKPNWFIGIRTPWTLSSDTVWRKTHQLFGKIWFYGGLACAVIIFLAASQVWAKYTILGFILGSTVFAFAYFFWLYRRGKDQAENEIKSPLN